MTAKNHVQLGRACRLAVFALALMPSAVPAATRPALHVDALHIAAPGVSDKPLRVRVAVPRRCAQARCDTLYVDDGQDAEAVGLFDTVAALDAAGDIRAPIVVAIDMPIDRMGAYGFSDRAAGAPVIAPTKYGPVGTRAHAYSEWLVHTLVPRIDARYRTRATAASRAVLGWSLGGAHAFNVAWQYPETFGRAGAFSPSFWLARDPRDAAAVQRTRIAQSMLASGAPNGLRLFLAVGTDEEQDDRDGDGVNDAVDDVRELIDGGDKQPGLRALGYRVDADGAVSPGHGDVALYLLPGGIHRQSSWARMLPAFLRWAYAPPSSRGASQAD